MTIVVLGWGSLCWDPRELRIRDGWHTDGPLLPIELARISSYGRLTLVLFQQSERVPVLWAEMDMTTVNEAIDDLNQREGTNKNSIGSVDLNNRSNNCKVVRSLSGVIERWAKNNHFDAAVWTDLPANFREMTGMEFTENNVITYLSNLDNDSSRKAEEYIRKAPPQIGTRMRTIIEERLGWTYNGDSA
jgi:hypothetical protein